MLIPQYNVQLTDTGSQNYNQPAYRPAPAPPKVNPLKNWWNSIVNNARQNAYAPVNTWETVAPNVPIPGVNGFGPTMLTAYGTNRRGSYTGLNARQMLLMQIYGTPAGEDYDQYDIGGPQQKYLNGVESLESLIARGAVDPYGHDPYEVGGSPYEYYPAVTTPELPPYQPGGGGYVGGGGGGGGYTAMPSSPGYTGYGGGYNPSGAPRAVYSQGRGSGYVSGYGGYAGGQSQRSAWYGALLQWNI